MMEARAPAARLVIRRPELSGPVLERVVAALAARVRPARSTGSPTLRS